MCHLVRDQQDPTGDGAGSTVPPASQRLRPRWIGVAAAGLMAGVAVAALLAPPPSSPPSNETQTVAAAVPLAAGTFTTPVTTAVGLHPVLVDDEVPSAAANKAVADSCHHGM